jgi:hypothetical protein
MTSVRPGRGAITTVIASRRAQTRSPRTPPTSALHVEFAGRPADGHSGRAAHPVRARDLEWAPTAFARRAGPVATDAVLAVAAGAGVSAGARLRLAGGSSGIALASARAIAQPVGAAHRDAIVEALVARISPDLDWTAASVVTRSLQLGRAGHAGSIAGGVTANAVGTESGLAHVAPG